MGLLREPSASVRLGVQVLLGTLAVAAIVVVVGFPSDPAGWAVVALVVVLGDTFGQSFQASVSRIQGSIIGCLSGAAASLLLPTLWLPLRVGAGVALSYGLCLLFRVKAGMKLGLALAGFFVFVPGSEEVATVGWRLAATILGILIALVIELVLWPRRSGAALDGAISDALLGIGRRCSEVVDQWVSGVGMAPAVEPRADVPRMRALLAESRREPGRTALPPDQYDEVIAGIDMAALGIRHLVDNAVQGEMVAHLGDGLRDSAGRIERACAELSRFSSASPGDVEHDLYRAVERMRSQHVTPGASAEELVHLFAALNGVALVAEGLVRVSSAMRPD